MRLVWTVMGPLWLLQMYRLSWTAHWTSKGGFSLLGNSEFYGSFWQPNTLKCNAGRQKILSKSPHATKPCTGLARPMLFNLSNIMSLWFYFTQQYLCTKWLELQVKTFAESGLPMYLACLCIWPTHLQRKSGFANAGLCVMIIGPVTFLIMTAAQQTPGIVWIQHHRRITKHRDFVLLQKLGHFIIQLKSINEMDCVPVCL